MFLMKLLGSEQLQIRGIKKNKMILQDIIEELCRVAPEEYAQDWDNCGLLAGDRAQDITKIYIALDADDEAIEQAKNVGAQLLLTHHPLIFSPLKKVNKDYFISARIVELLHAHMNLYAMHTNFDAAVMGTLAASYIDLPVEGVLADAFVADEKEYGIGVVGNYASPQTLEEICRRVKEAFGLQAVKLFGDAQTAVSRIAICPGSGKSTISDALRAGAQVLLTGDIDHHSGIDALAQGLTIIDAGHYGIEHIFIRYMESYLKTHLQGVEIYAKERQEPFIFL